MFGVNDAHAFSVMVKVVPCSIVGGILRHRYETLPLVSFVKWPKPYCMYTHKGKKRFTEQISILYQIPYRSKKSDFKCVLIFIELAWFIWKEIVMNLSEIVVN